MADSPGTTPVSLANPEGPAGPAEALGRNLRRLRLRAGLSLDRLSRLSGVSRAMLGQVENGKSAPTINVVWKVATALNVPFSTLFVDRDDSGTVVLRHDEAKILTSIDGKFTSRALFPFDNERRTEFYELRIAPRHAQVSQPHAPGTRENLVVVRGTVEVSVAREKGIALSEGDALFFHADQTHRYRNLSSEEAVLYLVMTYVEAVG